MLISQDDFTSLLKKYAISTKGILHIGAHECEEKDFYNSILRVPDSNIVWVDANDVLVKKNISKGIRNIYTAALDESSRLTTFNITNNGQSSSLLNLGTHKESYPDIQVVEKKIVKTETLPQFFKRIQENPARFNIWNLDIQGAEYNVLKGAGSLLNSVDVIYTEVNEKEVYEKAGLLGEIDSLLQAYGFKRVRTEMTPQGWGDAMYIKTSEPFQNVQENYPIVGILCIGVGLSLLSSIVLKELLPKKGRMF